MSNSPVSTFPAVQFPEMLMFLQMWKNETQENSCLDAAGQDLSSVMRFYQIIGGAVNVIAERQTHSLSLTTSVR